MTTQIRNQGKCALSHILKVEQNINILEQNVYQFSSKQNEFERIYKMCIFQVVSDILAKKNIKHILSNIKQGKLGWEHEDFQHVKAQQDEQDDYIENPFNSEEGVVQCGKCGSKRTISFSKQMRGGDEGTSVICNCIECKHHWIIGG